MRIWIFRMLVIASSALMISSFYMPWWIAVFTKGLSSSTGSVDIYGWGLSHSLTLLAGYVTEDVTPLYQSIIAWVYMGISVCLALGSTWLKSKKGQLILGGIGAVYMLYTAIAVFVVISNRIAYDHIPLQGSTVITLQNQMDFITVESGLCPGYYLAYAAGGLLIVLALIRGMIAGKTTKKSCSEYPAQREDGKD